MTPTATATAPELTTEQLAAELATAESELRTLTTKRDAEKKNFDQLTAEKGSLSTLYAKGSTQAADVSRNAHDLDLSESKLNGLNGLVADAEKRRNAAHQKLSKRRAAEATREDLAQIDALKVEAIELVEGFAAVLIGAGGPLARYEVVRKKLVEMLGQERVGLSKYPIPHEAQAAVSAIRELDKLIAAKLEPIFKALRRR